MTFENLNQIVKDHGAGYLVLIDPDKQSAEEVIDVAKKCEADNVDGLLIGGSLLFSTQFDLLIQQIKEAVNIPVILFPGNGRQISGFADAMLYMSLISGRNPQYLIDEQVHSAPVIHALKLETISTAYMLIESGRPTSAEFMSMTKPIPRHKPDITVAHALAAQYMGMKMIYLEAGSGAIHTVPDQMIAAVEKYVELPLIVGGGIRSPEEAVKKVKAGASFIVTGTILEDNGNHHMIKEFSKAIHGCK